MFQDSLFSQRPPVSPAPPVEPVQGVSKVVDYIRRIIEGNKTLAGIRVCGEVSELRERNGRLYFSLKENADVLRCMVWPNYVAKLPTFKNGDAIVCGGTYTAYTPGSIYELIVSSVELTGIGALYAQFEALKEKFRKEGLFEVSRKRPIPSFPKRIAVVSTQGGKGVEDFFTILRRDAPFLTVIPIDTRVQGDGAEIDIAEAIDKAARSGPDLIVVTRGGGSYEDLFPFNREPVVRAIVRAKVPVISAVGHTGDVHLSDLVADKSFETPSNAAHYLADIGKRFQRRIDEAQSRMLNAARAILTARAQAFDFATSRLTGAAREAIRERERALHGLERRLSAQTPQNRLLLRVQRIAALKSRLEAASRYYAAPRRDAIGRLAERLSRLQRGALRPYGDILAKYDAKLDGLSPHALLARGYAIVTLDGRAVRNAADVPQGEVVEAQLQHGKLYARVERKDLDG
ncbi:MAG TPA: exodeoxyribonuclease VII large subunit [Candidatus Baltobacteraceae bacterium]|nr:exodeoxyribonuclease VII large subunit [Candidatus Baltobacteraceae bacterium]